MLSIHLTYLICKLHNYNTTVVQNSTQLSQTISTGGVSKSEKIFRQWKTISEQKYINLDNYNMFVQNSTQFSQRIFTGGMYSILYCPLYSSAHNILINHKTNFTRMSIYLSILDQVQQRYLVTAVVL